MATARPLRDVFTDLVGHDGSPADAAEVLRASGHADLPDGLVAEAVVNFADTAPLAVAEHLTPFVTAHSPVPQPDPGLDAELDAPNWLEALTSAPVADDLDPAAALDATDHGGYSPDAGALAADPDPSFDFGQGDLGTSLDHDSAADLDDTFDAGRPDTPVSHLDDADPAFLDDAPRTFLDADGPSTIDQDPADADGDDPTGDPTPPDA